MTLVKVVIVVGLLFAAAGALAWAQSAPTPQSPKAAFVPSEVQVLRLQVRQRDAKLAQVVAQEAQARFQQAVGELMGEAERVKQDNSWPKTLQFNPDTLAFADVPATTPAATPATPAAAPTKP